MSQNESIKLLKEIYENTKTGIAAITLLLKKTPSDDFKKLLFEQENKYHEIAEEALMQLSRYRELPPDGGVFSKLNMWTSVQMNMVNTSKTDKMAEVMINGSTEGVIEITRMLNNMWNVNPHVGMLANKLIAAEQDNIRIMHQFL